ncbi:hexuronate operon repressor, LacI family [Companilactobacillus nodensis DSM 19682 = JCM 14932 = NBRC 107160]|uniref:Hexuronate operon repressor, LacI family n=1 Tax=Companilactobacillus nodensis DSM 19682 = JCM 14932 = NBRC 107160 TaxID=1423775 RepID=A0A0R1KEP7_9LACO|nr:LacI family DNA-binding transcriptional regulator [Companilactobacillus nodensis]KRK78881.1 hexuronate operon repressor, LacI family [Companilactobacillus nodensis DSM 19682 = JCM 14932 = NBRC 107160]
MQKATIKDVSERSGFSITTISRVLNGNYPVKKETREKIMKAIDELNFSRNSSARNLRTKKSNLIGLVVADINNPYYSKIAKKIDDGLFEKGYNLLVCNTDESEEKEKRILSTLQDKDVDAIVISPAAKNIELLRQLTDAGTRIVLIDRNMGILDIPFVGSDNFSESKILTEYLIQQGHQKIMFVSGTDKAITAQDRLFGYKAALEENNLQFDEKNVVKGYYKQEDAYKNTYTFLTNNLKSDEPCTAIFSSNNLMTIGIIQAIHELNLRIPQDISLVSFGQLDSQEIIEPKVTCIKQNIEQLAKSTLEKTIEALDDNKSNIDSNIIRDSLEIGTSVKNLNK